MINAFLFGVIYIGFLILFCKYLDPKYNITDRLRKNKKIYIANSIIGTSSLVFALLCASLNWIDGIYIFCLVWLICTVISGNHLFPF
jgi:hypothetical protein